MVISNDWVEMSRSGKYSTVFGSKLSNREILNSHWFRQYLPSNTGEKKLKKNLSEFLRFEKFQSLLNDKNYDIFWFFFKEGRVVCDGRG